MHQDAYHFVALATQGHDFTKKHIVEIGSFDVNGSIRPLFDGCASYTGVDTREGPGVDVVAKGENYTPDKLVDVVVTTETLEHHPHPKKVIDQARAILKAGGLLIITAAGPERAPHGVNGGGVADEHYGNLTIEQLASWLADWDGVMVQHNARAGDVYAMATAPKRAKAVAEKAAEKTADDETTNASTTK